MNNELLLGKSEKNSNEFDAIHFARRDIKEVIIPSYVKSINQFSFSDCKHLTKVEFYHNSKLNSIGKYAFNNASISEIVIPSNCTLIDQDAFKFCNYLSNITFEKNSKLLNSGSFTMLNSLRSISFR